MLGILISFALLIYNQLVGQVVFGLGANKLTEVIVDAMEKQAWSYKAEHNDITDSIKRSAALNFWGNVITVALIFAGLIIVLV